MPLRSALSRQLKRFEKEFKTLNKVEISRTAVLANFDLFQQLQPGASLIPVLKSNAYGHGLTEIATILAARDFPYLAVDGYFEALRIQEVSRQKVLVLGAIHPDNFQRMDCRNCAFAVHEEATVKALGALKKPVIIHVELETGMHRHGVRTEELPAFLGLLKKFPNLQVEGVMSHLADADNPNPAYTADQVSLFDTGINTIKAAGFTPSIFHLAQTAGSTKVESHYANALRIGLGLYGINPLTSEDAHYQKLGGLQPALSLTSTITKINELQPGETLSYGRTFKAQEITRVGILPLGYYEGVPRALSNAGTFLLKGQPVPVIGKVNMNHCMVNLTDVEAAIGDEVLVISNHPDDPNSINSLASQHDLFSYSLLTGINQNLRRVITV